MRWGQRFVACTRFPALCASHSSRARTGRRVVAKKRQRENCFRNRDLRRGPRLARARMHARRLARVSAGGWIDGRFLAATLASL